MNLAVKLCAFVAISGSITFAAEKVALIKGKILDFGTYRVIKSNRDVPIRDEAGQLLDAVRISPKIEFLTHTDYIVARKGVSFGFTYKLVNLPTNAPTMVTIEILHPAIIKPDGQTNYGEGIQQVIPQSKDGMYTNHIGYHLDEEYDLVEGDWTMSISSENGRLISKSFHLAGH